MMECTIRILSPDSAVAIPSRFADLGLPTSDLVAWTQQARRFVLQIRVSSDRTALVSELLTRNAPGLLVDVVESDQRPSIVLMGTQLEISTVIKRLETVSHPLAGLLSRRIERTLKNVTSPIPFATRIGPRRFQWGQRTYVMGIVNVTPDSFSDDGLLHPRQDRLEDWVAAAVEQAVLFCEQGADIIDIGGESTRPGATPVDAETEAERVLPAIRAIRQTTDIPISIDTYKADVARAAIEAGADMVNDVWAFLMDPEMGAVVAESGVPVILMHNRSRPKDARQEEHLGGRYVGVRYDDLLLDVLAELEERVDEALQMGIGREQIIVDPGLGFGKTVRQNLALLNRSDELRSLGQPILLGPSRKSFIGYTLDLPPQQRTGGTLAAVAMAIARNGADLVRVHDVGAAVQTVRMADTITRSSAGDAGRR